MATKALGIVFANMHDDSLGQLTDKRSMASLPFGGRYRLIDFYLSSLVSAGINKVGVIAKNNYQSLMDHVGSGRAWDLSRKNSGLTVFPPHSLAQEHYYHGRIQAIYNIIKYIENSNVEYVVMMDCNHVCNIDIQAMIDEHISSGADVTMACRERLEGEDAQSDIIAVHCGESGRIDEMLINACEPDFMLSMNVFIIGRDLLVKLVEQAHSRMKLFFEQDILSTSLDKLNVHAYKFNGFCRRLYDLKSYFDANMALLNPENMHSLFPDERPVYTKVRDQAPVRYGLDARVKNTLAADGCVILGDVENCLLFRGVTVGENVVLRNCIVMQDTTIGGDSSLEYVITDKEVTINPGHRLTGDENYPLYIKKLSVI